MALEQSELREFADRFLAPLEEPQRARLFLALCALNIDRLHNGTSRVRFSEDPWPLTPELIKVRIRQQIQGLFGALKSIPQYAQITGILMLGDGRPYILRPNGDKQYSDTHLEEVGLITSDDLRSFIDHGLPVESSYYEEFPDFSYPLWSQMLLAFINQA